MRSKLYEQLHGNYMLKKKMKTTKISGWLVMAAAWVVMTMMTMMTMTACSSEGDDILGGNGPEQPAQSKGVMVTVKAGISDGSDATGSATGTTRSAVDTDANNKRTLKFTAGDKLFVMKQVSDNDDVNYVGGMLTMVGEPSADGKSATFTGEVEAYGKGNAPATNYEIGANPLEGTEATLVHAAMVENDYSIVDDGSFDFKYPYAANVETLMTRGLQVRGTYQNGGYSLNSVNPIINCSLSGLAPSTDYKATLRYPSSSGYYQKGYGIFTTDASGAGTVAFDAYESGTQDWQIEISLYNSGTTVGTISLGNRELTTKVYNVTRYWTGSEFIKAEPKEIPLTVQALTAGNIMVGYPKSGMQYSLNGGEKTTMTGTTTINVSAGDKVQLYGDGTNITSYLYTMITGGTAQVKVYGNIMSLVDEENFATATTLTASNTFLALFADYKNLTDASGLLLPATTLANSCYYSMFGGCTSLTAAPKLPAETLANHCYEGMFDRCTSLTSAPETLPAETLADYCYYSMFGGCTSLTAAPVLPAEKLTSSCYEKMFKGCSNLSSVTCLATVIYYNSTRNWLDGVAATGTFTKAASMTVWSTGVSGIPSGWTVKDAE